MSPGRLSGRRRRLGGFVVLKFCYCRTPAPACRHPAAFPFPFQPPRLARAASPVAFRHCRRFQTSSFSSTKRWKPINIPRGSRHGEQPATQTTCCRVGRLFEQLCTAGIPPRGCTAAVVNLDNAIIRIIKFRRYASPHCILSLLRSLCIALASVFRREGQSPS